MVEFIIANTDKDDRIAGLPYVPGFNFLAQRLMPNPYVYVFTDPDLPQAKSAYESDIREGRIPYIIYRPHWKIHETPESRISEYAPKLHTLIRYRYTIVMRWGNVYLLKYKLTDR